VIALLIPLVLAVGLLVAARAGKTQTSSVVAPTPQPLPVQPLPPPSTQPLPKKPSRVLLIGDSLAVGMRPYARSSGATVEAEGGTTARQWLGRVEALLIRDRPEVLLVSAGTNDAAGKITSSSFAAQAAQMSQLAAKYGARCVWLFPPPMPFSLQSIRDGLIAADVAIIEPPAGLPRAPDRIHLPGAGYAAWWAHVAATLG